MPTKLTEAHLLTFLDCKYTVKVHLVDNPTSVYTKLTSRLLYWMARPKCHIYYNIRSMMRLTRFIIIFVKQLLIRRLPAHRIPHSYPILALGKRKAARAKHGRTKVKYTVRELSEITRRTKQHRCRLVLWDIPKLKCQSWGPSLHEARSYPAKNQVWIFLGNAVNNAIVNSLPHTRSAEECQCYLVLSGLPKLRCQSWGPSLHIARAKLARSQILPSKRSHQGMDWLTQTMVDIGGHYQMFLINFVYQVHLNIV